MAELAPLLDGFKNQAGLSNLHAIVTEIKVSSAERRPQMDFSCAWTSIWENKINHRSSFPKNMCILVLISGYIPWKLLRWIYNAKAWSMDVPIFHLNFCSRRLFVSEIFLRQNHLQHILIRCFHSPITYTNKLLMIFIEAFIGKKSKYAFDLFSCSRERGFSLFLFASCGTVPTVRPSGQNSFW